MGIFSSDRGFGGSKLLLHTSVGIVLCTMGFFLTIFHIFFSTNLGDFCLLELLHKKHPKKSWNKSIHQFTKTLVGGNSNVFYVHPYLGRWSNLTSIFFKWVETTNQKHLAILAWCFCSVCLAQEWWSCKKKWRLHSWDFAIISQRGVWSDAKLGCKPWICRWFDSWQVFGKKTNMEPKNTSLEDDFPVERGDFVRFQPFVFGGVVLARKIGWRSICW